MSIREDLLLWAGQFENDHYVFEAYGDEYTVDLPRETVEAAIDIAITLVDRAVAAKGDAVYIHDDGEGRDRRRTAIFEQKQIHDNAHDGAGNAAEEFA